MRKLRTLQLARVGKFGQDGAEITKADLAEVAETFTPKRPVTVGHDGAKTDMEPKFGDVFAVALAEGGNVLNGEVAFRPEMEGLYSDGYYDGWSVSIPRRASDGKRYLHHLAILGATPPKIPGLEELSAVDINYGDGDVVANFQFSGKIPEEEEKVDPKDKRIADLEAENAALKKKPAEVAPVATQAAEAAPAADATKDAAFADQMKKMSGELLESRVNNFEGRIKDKVPAGILPKARELAKRIGEADAFEFADGDKKRSARPIEVLEEILSAWPKIVSGPSGNDYSDATGADGKPIDWNALAAKA